MDELEPCPFCGGTKIWIGTIAGCEMARFIDADRALEIVYEHGIAHPNVYYLTNYTMAILQEAPTVDAVEVVRCEFCKNAEPYDCTIDGTIHRLYECKKDKTAIGYNKVVAKNDFCSCGERKGR